MGGKKGDKQMKRTMVMVLVLMLCFAIPCLALQGQQQGQMQGQAQKAVSRVIDSGNSMQGQGQESKAVSRNDNSDNSKSEVVAVSFASMSGTKGVSELQGSLYGLGLAITEEYDVCIQKLEVINTMDKLGYLTKEEAKIEANKVFAQLKDSTKPKRIFGFGPKTRGRHLFNLFGLAATDSWVNEDKVNARILEKELFN